MRRGVGSAAFISQRTETLFEISLLLYYMLSQADQRQRRIVAMKWYRTFWEDLKKQTKFIWLNTSFFIEDLLMKQVNRTDLLNNCGKTLVITGGTRGIGAEAIKLLLQCDFQIVIGCRNCESAKKLLQEARCEGITSGQLIAYNLDVSSFKSVRNFAKIIQEKHPKIHVLLNSAGVLNVPYELTEDGIESVFATNYLGHFLLTHLLLPQLNKACEEGIYRPRIVNVTSCAHFTGKINFADLNYSENYNYPDVYSQSKLAQIMFAKHLAKKLKERNENIDVFCVHPGMCQTDIFQNTIIKSLGFPFLFKTAKQGAIPIVHTCISPYLNDRSGVYISNCRIKPSSKRSTNEALQEQLFEASLKLTKIDDYFNVK